MKKGKTDNDVRKVPFKVYLQNTWQLYAMLILPVVYMLCFRYKPMVGTIIAFEKFNEIGRAHV